MNSIKKLKSNKSIKLSDVVADQRRETFVDSVASITKDSPNFSDIASKISKYVKHGQPSAQLCIDMFTTIFKHERKDLIGELQRKDAFNYFLQLISKSVLSEEAASYLGELIGTWKRAAKEYSGIVPLLPAILKRLEEICFLGKELKPMNTKEHLADALIQIESQCLLVRDSLIQLSEQEVTQANFELIYELFSACQDDYNKIIEQYSDGCYTKMVSEFKDQFDLFSNVKQEYLVLFNNVQQDIDLMTIAPKKGGFGPFNPFDEFL